MKALILLFIESCLLISVASEEPTIIYPSDDVSWAVQSTQLKYNSFQERYDRFLEGCNEAARRGVTFCQREDNHRLKMNREQPQSVYNYTEMGYAKIKAPKELFQKIQSFYLQNKGSDETEWKSINTYHNMWEAPPTMMHLNNRKFKGGGADLQASIWDVAKPLMEDWTGQELSPVSLYGIRVYHNGSILAPHVDRMPLVTSAISKCSWFQAP